MLFFCSVFATESFSNKARYAILIPMNDESIQLLEILKDKKQRVINGVHYIEGRIDGSSVVFANAGLGKTNISLITARLIRDYHPQFIFLAGSAGGINSALDKQSIVIGKRIIDADLGMLTDQGPYYLSEEYFTTPQKNNAPIPKEYAADPLILNAVYSVIKHKSQDNIIIGSIATSDILPNTAEQTKLLKINQIDAVEMEGAAFMQACWLFDTRCLVVRGISNAVDDIITKEDTMHAGANAVGVVQNVMDYLTRNQ